MLLLAPAALPAQTLPATGEIVPAPFRIFFITDAHSRHDMVARFIEAANHHRPDLVLDGGDMVHDGTATEFRRALAERARLDMPWHFAPGNHDVILRGPFPPGTLPPLPAFQTFEQGGIRFILLDNSDGLLTESQFQQLDAELAARPGTRAIVVMHVPAFMDREPTLVRLRHLLPFPLASPVMRDADQAERFMAMMRTHRVLAVLAGHTHAFNHTVRDGVHYIIGGALGGLTPATRIGNEYTEIVVEDRSLSVTRTRIAEPAGHPVAFLAGAFRFYVDLNRFNHAGQGWNYIPSASVQLRAAVVRSQAGGEETTALLTTAAFERVLGPRGRHSFIAETGVAAGSREVAVHLAGGGRIRPVGDFNRNLFIGAAATGGAGARAGRLAAGLGAELGAGVEWRHFTLEASVHRATHRRATRLTLGHRF
jgi:predicted phosphodiesterase